MGCGLSICKRPSDEEAQKCAQVTSYVASKAGRQAERCVDRTATRLAPYLLDRPSQQSDENGHYSIYMDLRRPGVAIRLFRNEDFVRVENDYYLNYRPNNPTSCTASAETLGRPSNSNSNSNRTVPPKRERIYTPARNYN